MPIILLICLALLAGLVGCAAKEDGTTKAQPDSAAGQQVKLSISAAASLKDALVEVEQAFHQEQPKIDVENNFGSSGSLQQQIENGAPCDVFVSAAAKQMDALEAKGLLLEGTRKNLLGNQVVLIAPKSSTAVTGFNSLGAGGAAVVALGEPKAVPAGKYAQEVLTALKLWDKVKPKTVYAKDVRQVLTYVETQNADAGIVYLTDAKMSDKVKVVAVASENTHSPVVYPMAVIKASKDQAASRLFAEFLQSQKATEIFARYGFTVPVK